MSIHNLMILIVGIEVDDQQMLSQVNPVLVLVHCIVFLEWNSVDLSLEQNLKVENIDHIM